MGDLWCRVVAVAGGNDTDDLTGPATDGISDALERNLVDGGATAPVTTMTDSDGDGVPDYFEVRTGSDPFDPNSPVTAGGNDVVDGGTGDDTLAGQNGSDQMSGGAGADVFLFTNTNHSAVGSRDDILDFQKGQDKSDIDGLSNDTFVFLGNGAFTAMGDAEVRVTSNAAGNSVVRIDVDGDGTADSEIDVLGVTGLEAGDFIL